MKDVDLVILGSDWVTESDFTNKIGTYSLALTARELGKPVYVAADRTKFVWRTLPPCFNGNICVCGIILSESTFRRDSQSTRRLIRHRFRLLLSTAGGVSIRNHRRLIRIFRAPIRNSPPSTASKSDTPVDNIYIRKLFHRETIKVSQYLYLVLLVMTSYGLSRSRERLFGDSPRDL